MPPSRLIRFPRRDMLRLIAALPLVGIAGVDWALARQAPPARLVNASTAELVAGNTAFALDLYAALRDSIDGNLLISPYSVSQALAMTYAGARGRTAAQMKDVLAFTFELPALHEAFSGLNADIVSRGNAVRGHEDPRTLAIANALWLERTYPFDPAYVAALEPAYGPALHQADFVHRPEETREEINTWVEDRTEDRIQNIVPPGFITKGTLFAIVNAIYFYGSWQRAFDPADTHEDLFILLDGTPITVPLMFQVADLPYAQGDGYQVVELPYAESGLALTVILPDEERFAEIDAALDAGTLDAAIEQLHQQSMHVYLPRFALAFGTVDLKETLRALGMLDAFSSAADLTGMVDMDELVQRDLLPPMIAHVLHKAFIGVDEKGTEAAAATVVLGTPRAMPSVEVRIDRPFLFAIRDTQTGTILFLGRVLDPSAEDLGLWRRVKGSAT